MSRTNCTVAQKVSVVGVPYTIKRDQDKELLTAGFNGRILFNDKEIHILSTLSGATYKKVLLHEVIHAVLHEMSNPEDTNERLVDAVADGLFTVDLGFLN